MKHLETTKDALLAGIDSPEDLRRLSVAELNTLADEIRNLIVNTVAVTGGHLASSLGAVELTLALHYVFSTPGDKLVWDVGHQCYAHKIITGRKNSFSTLRRKHLRHLQRRPQRHVHRGGRRFCRSKLSQRRQIQDNCGDRGRFYDHRHGI